MIVAPPSPRTAVVTVIGVGSDAIVAPSRWAAVTVPVTNYLTLRRRGRRRRRGGRVAGAGEHAAVVVTGVRGAIPGAVGPDGRARDEGDDREHAGEVLHWARMMAARDGEEKRPLGR